MAAAGTRRAVVLAVTFVRIPKALRAIVDAGREPALDKVIATAVTVILLDRLRVIVDGEVRFDSLGDD